MYNAFRLRKILIGLFLGVILSFCLFPTALWAKDVPSQLRVGFFAFDGYHMVDAESGERSGYGYDLLQHIAAYGDWTYEYIGYDKGWNDMLRMLENGEIDVLTSAQKTEEREKKFDFSTEPIGYSSTILTVAAGNDQFLSGEEENWNGMRVGLMKGNSRNDSFARYAEEQGFTYEAVYFDDTEEMLSALKNGKDIDAVVSSNLRVVSGEWVLAEFDSSPFYIMVKKGNTALLTKINVALDKALQAEPGFLTQLWNKYYVSSNGNGELSFSASEREYIESMQGKKLTAIINPDRAPLSYFREGKADGIMAELTAEIFDRSGLDIEIIEPTSREDYRVLCEKGETDLILDARHDFSSTENAGYKLTIPYLSATLVMLHPKNDTANATVALVKNSDIAKTFYKQIKEESEEIVYYETTADAVDAVLNGDVDAFYTYNRMAAKVVYEDVTNRLTYESVYGASLEFAVAVQAEEDIRLISVLNTAINSMSDGEVSGIIAKYTNFGDKNISVKGFIYGYPFAALMILIVFFALFVLVVVLLYNKKKRAAEHYQMLEEQRRNALLSDALAAAEKADAAKSRFLSQVSHEMRTPLNAIIGFMSLAEEENIEKEQIKAYLNDSQAAARQLLDVINDVLDMSAIEAGKMKIATEPFDMKQLICSLTTIYGRQCMDKGISYETKILSPVDEWLIGDRLRVNQVLINLLGNAVKFTDRGGVELRIFQRETDDKRIFIRFEVSDSGCGMSEEMQARLFKPFEQESAATAQKYGGSGLGLSIVRSLVAMMGGAISVESEIGKGSTFRVELTFERSVGRSNVKIDADVAKLRILVIDDEPAECAYVSEILNRLKVDHRCVHTSEEALTALDDGLKEDNPYNTCLVDWQIPEIDGLDITKEIRAKYGAKPVIIVVSAYEHYQIDDAIKAVGADMYVSKPLFQSTLFDLLMNITDGRIAVPEEKDVTFGLPGHHLLLAEDNLMNCMVAEGLLKKYGVTCDKAMNGNEAVAMFTQAPAGTYDAILMDIQMPELDGFGATQAIRGSGHEEARTIPIIALTANAFNEDVTKALSAGMNDHVAKPIDPKRLAKALDRVFKRKEGK